MSTRSGKRIHGLEAEDNVDNLSELKSVRKTRKQLKEICDNVLAEKKKKNFVRYPSEENVALGSCDNIENLNKPTRKSRRNTLKEQNLLITDSETSNDEKKIARVTRRTKKFDSDVLQENVPLNIENNDVTVEKKKGKKKKIRKSSIENENMVAESAVEEPILKKKKSNKKKTKKRSNSVIVESVIPEPNKSLNKSNGSIDSFHSAAGSPLKNSQECLNDHKNEPVSSMQGIKKRKKKLSGKLLDNNNKHKGDGGKNKVEKDEIEKLLLEKSPIQDNLTDTENMDLKQNQIINTTVEKVNSSLILENNVAETGSEKKSSARKSICKADLPAESLNSTFEMMNLPNKTSSSKKRKSITLDRNSICGTNLNTTYEKENSLSSLSMSTSKQRKSSIKNSTYDKIENLSKLNLDATYEKEHNSCDVSKVDMTSTKSPKLSTCLNNTYEKETKSISRSLDETYDKNESANSTISGEKSQKINPTMKKRVSERLNSLISSDTTDSKSDLTDDNSRISITSDESKENIVNTTPVLIESSLDESLINGVEKNCKSPSKTVNTVNIQTPLKREGTFNTDEATLLLKRDGTYTDLKPATPVREDTCSKTRKTPVKTYKENATPNKDKSIGNSKTISEDNEVSHRTPLKREGTFTKDSHSSPEPDDRPLPSPGSTPFPFSKGVSIDKSMLDIARSSGKRMSSRSMEKRMSSLIDAAPRTTKVMFCSPVNNPAVVTQMKGKIIKSNLKGSNKSFIFDESVSESDRPARKRSYTQSEAEHIATKRSRLTERQNNSVERLSRPRTTSASARLQDHGTPAKKPTTPSKAKPEKVSRTKLPNFAALHQKQFEKMESLDECQERKAKRARQLLTPTAPINVLERTSPKDQQSDVPKKPETPKKHSEVNPGYSRFGFKFNLDVNPFSIPKTTTEMKPRDKPVVLKRQATLPSLAGATNLRKNIAKQTIMREKSFTEKRNVDRKETRTVIKGVRTNRRFELQMRMRNINEK